MSKQQERSTITISHAVLDGLELERAVKIVKIMESCSVCRNASGFESSIVDSFSEDYLISCIFFSPPKKSVYTSYIKNRQLVHGSLRL